MPQSAHYSLPEQNRRNNCQTGSLQQHLSTVLTRFLTAMPGASLLMLLCINSAWSATVDLTGTPVAAISDQACIGTHAGTNLGCTAKEFTVGATFSAAPGTPPFCVAGSSFDFLVDLQLSGSNANRYDITFYTGQTGNNPDINDAAKLCSAAAFPLSLPAPWSNLDGGLNLCGDYISGGDSIIRVNRIKVKCAGDSAGYLTVPYTLAYEQNTGNPTCNPNSPATYPIPTKSKCQTGISTVSGTVKVFSGAYVDITKQTLPDGDGQAFSFDATGSSGSSVSALTGSTTLSLPQPTDGTYTPSTAAATTNTVNNITLTDGNTARFYINALDVNQNLTITEAATTNWESTASIVCNNVNGTPNPTINNASRTISVNLNTTNSAAACTITNMKRARITLQKSLAGRIDAADQFTVSASGGGTLTGTTSATTTGSGTSAGTTFYSTPSTPLTLSDTKAAGTTPLSRYDTSLTCTNAYSGPGATPNGILPNNQATTSITFTPAPGDDITCTFTNTPRPAITKAFGTAMIAQGQSIPLTFTITNILGSPAQNNLAFTDSLPPEISVTGAATSQCGGSVSFTTNSISLSGGSLASGVGSCTITASVTSTAIGTWINGSGNMNVAGGNLYNAVSDQSLQVVSDATLTILKTADKGSAKPGEIITYTLLITNTGYLAASDITISDILSPYIAFGTNSYPASPAPAGPAFEVSGSGTVPVPGAAQYYDQANSPVVPTGTFDGDISRWRLPFTGTLDGNGTNFTIKYKVQVK